MELPITEATNWFEISNADNDVLSLSCDVEFDFDEKMDTESESSTSDEDLDKEDGINVLLPASIETRLEIINLKSNILPEKKLVTIELEKSVLQLGADTPLSPTLRNLIWKTAFVPKTQLSRFAAASIVENILETKDSRFQIKPSDRTIAFFGAVFRKPAFFAPSLQAIEKDIENKRNINQKLNVNTHLPYHIYHDFSVIIMKGSKVVDYAVHAEFGNINEVLRKHEPETVYFLGHKDSSLARFLSYRYQPFAEHSTRTFYGLDFQMNYQILQFCEKSFAQSF